MQHDLEKLSAAENFNSAENLTAETTSWVTSDGQMTPHLEGKFPTDGFDQASLTNAITARIDGRALPGGPLERQIAYKLYLGARTDLEDAAHLYGVFHESRSTPARESWGETLAVEEEYARRRT